jgi:hypothetical protein
MRLLKELDQFTAAKLKKALFLGRLTLPEELDKEGFGALFAAQNDLQDQDSIPITCLSEVPPELSQIIFIPLGYFKINMNSTVNTQTFKKLIPLYEKLLPHEKKTKLQAILNHKLIIFRLQPIDKEMHLEIHRIEHVVPKEGYVCIPQPALSLSQGRKDLEESLMQGRPIKLTSYPNLFREPKLIYCENYIYSECEFSQTNHPTMYHLTNPNFVKRWQVSDDFHKQVDARIASELLYVREDEMSDLETQMKKEGVYLKELHPAAPIQTHNELEFLKQLELNAQIRGLYYDPDDLLNLHISIKTNLLTIIGGMSGTGKSQLARLYGETLNLRPDETMLMIPISPAYHEPNDILGYFNGTTGVYHESETGLVKLLLHAQAYPEQLHMVIFDEMNLSQVEHWFSPFISLIEVEAPHRRLTLYQAGEHAMAKETKVQPTIQLGDNLIFVGTINFDETAKGFSDRLLDRANILIPRKLTLREARDRKLLPSGDNLIQTSQVEKSVFRGKWLREQGDLETLSQEEVRMLDRIHEFMVQQDRQRGISFRVARAMARYIANIPLDRSGKQLISREIAFDLQLKQRVLSKLSGSENMVGKLIGSYQGEQYQEGTLAKYLVSPEAQQISTFRHSLKFMKEKARELTIHGYTH